MSAMKEFLEEISQEMGRSGEITDAVISEGKNRMKFQKNDTVKVQINGKWVSGVFLKDAFTLEKNWQYVVKIGENLVHFDKNDVRWLQKLPENAISEMIANQFQQAAQYTKEILEKLLPGESFTTTVPDQENIISLHHGQVTVEPQIYEIQTIGGFREHAGWTVNLWKAIPATYHTEMDVDFSTVGNFPTYHKAIQKALEVVFALKVEEFSEQAEMYNQGNEI